MKRFTPLYLVTLCSLYACVSQPIGDVAFDSMESRAAFGIALCHKEYLRRSGDAVFLADADRAYVLILQDQMDILFTSGAMGVYEERSKNYRSYLFCTTSESGNSRVKILMPTQAEPLLYNDDVPEIVDLGDKKGPVTEAIFLRRKGNFRFWKKMDFETVGDYKRYSSEKLSKY